jgi:proteasome beta subunit
MRYRDGVLVAGDRRATAGHAVIYNKADKVIPLDDYTVMAISGSPAIAYEISRILDHSFQYHRRRQLQEMSLEAKLRRLSLLIRDNLPMALQGIGAVIPILAAYDKAHEMGRIYFYDAMGAQFEVADFSTSGSGAPGIRGALFYQNRWGRPVSGLDRSEAIGTALRLLYTAAEHDSATGRYERMGDILPTVKTITAEGLADVDEDELLELQERFVAQMPDSGGAGA